MNQSVLKKTLWTAAAAVLLAALCILVPDGQILRAAQDALFTGEELPAFRFAVQPYGAVLAGGALAAFLIALWLCRRDVRAWDGIRFFVLSLGFGLLLARALYAIAYPGYYNQAWRERLAFLRIQDGGMLMTGAALGMLLAGMIVKPAKKMILFAFPAFVCAARIGELFTQLGYGPAVSFRNFLTRPQTRFTSNLNVSLIEAAVALALLAVMILRGRKQGLPFLFFLYGSLQVLMESLRRDQHCVWGFVKAQQVVSIVTALLCLFIAAGTRKGCLKALALTLPAAGIFLALEFALDKLDVNDWILYGVYAAALAGYIALGLRMFFRKNPQAAERESVP